MTFAAKVLGQGQLATTKGTLYTAPASTEAYVRLIRCYNTSTTTSQTINLYVNPAGTSRQICRVVLGPQETLEIDDALTLETGDTIEGDTTTATTVDYLITGAEET